MAIIAGVGTTTIGGFTPFHVAVSNAAVDVSSLARPSSAPTTTTTTTTTAASPATASTTWISAADADITHYVYFDVRISRADGTFYVRDDLPNTPDNNVFRGRLIMGLFGNLAPNHVQRFLSYFPSSSNGAGPDATSYVDNPYPSYGRSLFTKVEPSSGLLQAGSIPALELTDFNGSSALRYGGRILPAPLWIEKRNPDGQQRRVRHLGKGLLTHAKLDVTPAFGITTRSDTSVIDATHTVFGRLLFPQDSFRIINRDDGTSDEVRGNQDALDFLAIVSELPTYSIERPSSFSSYDPMTGQPSAFDAVAQSVFNSQRDFFRSFAKTVGDTRLDGVYDGKILRRVEVTQVGVL